MFRTTPIALIKTTSEVEPAEMNGSGTPVGGIEPVMTCYCTEEFITILLHIIYQYHSHN